MNSRPAAVPITPTTTINSTPVITSTRSHQGRLDQTAMTAAGAATISNQPRPVITGHRGCVTGLWATASFASSRCSTSARDVASTSFPGCQDRPAQVRRIQLNTVE